jgi:hypothetical protein
MTNEDINRTKLRLDEERLELEKAQLQLENSFSKKYFVPLLSILGATVVGVFALAQVWIASIQKAQEHRCPLKPTPQVIGIRVPS